MLPHFAFRVSSKTTDSRSVRIDCPKCGRRDSPATATDVTEKILLLHFVPVVVSHPTYVACACGAKFTASEKAAFLSEREPSLIRNLIKGHVSPVLRALVYGGIIAWMLPLIGLVWASVALYLSRRNQRWMYRPIIALWLLSFVISSLLLINPILEFQHRHQTPKQTQDAAPNSVTPPAGQEPRHP
jgi:hypothetical protein